MIIRKQFVRLLKLWYRLVLIVILFSASLRLRSDPQALNDFLHGTNEVTKECIRKSNDKLEMGISDMVL